VLLLGSGMLYLLGRVGAVGVGALFFERCRAAGGRNGVEVGGQLGRMGGSEANGLIQLDVLGEAVRGGLGGTTQTMSRRMKYRELAFAVNINEQGK